MKESTRLSSGVFWSFLAIGTNAIVALLISILLARMLGPSDLGLYRLTRTITYLISVIISLGIPSAVTKFIAEQQDNHQQRRIILTAAIVLSGTIGAVISVLFYFIAPVMASFFSNERLIMFFQVASPILLLFFLNTTLQSYLVGLHEMRKFSFSILLENIVLAFFTVVLVTSGFGALGAIGALIFGAFLNTIYLVKSTELLHKLSFQKLGKKSRDLVAFGLHIFVSTVVNQANYRADVITLGYFLNEDEVGYYSVGITLGSFFLLIPRAIQKVTYPATSKYWGNDSRATLQELLDKTTRYTTITLLVLAFPFILFSQEIITILYGIEFLPSTLVLQILILGMIIDGTLGQSIGGTLSGIGRPDLSAKISAIVALVNILLLLILIPLWGIIGAAIATAFGFIVRGILTFYYSFSKTGTKMPWLWVVRMLATVGVFYLAHTLLQEIFPSLILFIRVVLTFLLGLVTWMFYLSKEDKQFLLSLARHHWNGALTLLQARAD